MNLGFPEMLFLGLLALLLFGPRRLPEIGRQIGKALGEFKRASSEFQTQLEDEVRQLEVQEDSQRSIAPPAAPEGSIAQTAAPSPASASPVSTGPASSPPLPASSGANGGGDANRGDGANGA
ncbi:MAG TPA: twin-arginine translocase TatA/TatE family subunit [Terriglobales bacterium]|nr:twin-arginine translocase TatA/TatE family subunit [Terriglobales bacterium]